MGVLRDHLSKWQRQKMTFWITPTLKLFVRSFPPVENVFKFSSKCLLFSMNNYGCEKPKSVYILQLMMGQAIIYQQRCALQNRFTLGNLINVSTLQLPSNFKVEKTYFTLHLEKLTARKLSSLPIRKDELERSPSLRV